MSSQSLVSGIPSDEIHLVWKDAREHLIPAMDRSGGRLDEASVLRALLKKEMQLWTSSDGALVTQIATYPTGLKAVSLLLVGGKMDKWLYFLDEIEMWARSNKCEVSEIPRGRKGWMKILNDYNSMMFMEKRI